MKYRTYEIDSAATIDGSTLEGTAEGTGRSYSLAVAPLAGGGLAIQSQRTRPLQMTL